MGSEEEKMAVLDILSLAQKPISLQELLERLGAGFTERSVRRWLTAMVKEGLVLYQP